MRDVQITIIEDNGNIIGELELSQATDFPLALTKSIASIKDVSKRSTYYSLDFNIPSTHSNNIILFGVNNINATLALKSILNKKRCVINVGGNLLERGFIRFSKSDLGGGYRATFFGGNADWVELLSEVDLNTLDWSNLGEVSAGVEAFTGSRISQVSQGDSDNFDISYPYIDRNLGSATVGFRPVLYMRKVVQRMFEKIGYTVESAFLDSPFVKGDGLENKGLALDPAANFTVDQEVIDQNSIAYSTDKDFSVNPTSWNLSYVLGNIDLTLGTTKTESKFPGLFNLVSKDTGGSFNSATSIYSVNVTGEYNIKLNVPDYLIARNRGFLGSPFSLYAQGRFAALRGEIPPYVELYIIKNNVSNLVIDGQVLAKTTTTGTSFTAESISLKFLLNIGDEVSFWFKILDNSVNFDRPISGYTNYSSPNALPFWRWVPGGSADISIQRSASIGIGDNYSINNHLPANLSCLDVLQDLKVLHNLYFVPNPQRKTILIEPRDSFYQDISNAEDITNRVNLNKPINTDYLSNYKRNLIFRYKKDSNDGYLARWEVNNLRRYGEYKHVLSNRFEKGETIFELKVIAPTIQGLIEPSKIVTSRILKHWDSLENDLLGINEEYDMRYYQLVRNQQFNRDGSPRRTSSPLIIESAMAEEFGNVPMLNASKLTFNGVNGLFAEHYAKTTTNIEQLSVVSLSQKMTLDQFRNLDFSRPVYISSPATIQGYYIYESVDNFDGIQDKPVKCKLLRWRNWTDATLNTNQGTNVSEGVLTPQNEPEIESLLFIYNEDDPLLPTTFEDVVEPDENNNIVKIYNT